MIADSTRGEQWVSALLAITRFFANNPGSKARGCGVQSIRLEATTVMLRNYERTVMRFRLHGIWAWFLILLSLCRPLWTQAVESSGQGAKNVSCTVAGSWSFARLCGPQAYGRVFTGTVLSVTDVSDFDERLELAPDESFSGDNPAKVSAVVNQACMPPNLPRFRAGDNWLFYFPRGENADALVLPFYGPSKPIARAQTDIELLHHVARLTNSAIVTGQVTQVVPKGNKWDVVPVAGRRVVVTRHSDGAEFSVLSDETGHFELQLAPGTYHVTANVEPKPLFSEGDVALVRPGDCVEVGFRLDTDKIKIPSKGSFWDRILIPPPELPDHIPEQP